MGIAEFTQRKGFKNFMAKLYGIGAAIVIIGALFKIQHWPFSGFFLVLGLGTEAVIFIFSAFEPPHEDVDWTLVYPELAGMEDEDSHGRKERRKKTDPVVQQLDRLMADAKIGPELIASLGTGLHRLGENTGKLADMSDAGVATENYVKNVTQAAKSAGEMSSSYTKAAAAVENLSNSTEEVRVYKDQVVIHALSDAEGLNPMITSDASATQIMYNLFQSLLNYDMNESMDLIPVLAKARPEITVLPDGSGMELT